MGQECTEVIPSAALLTQSKILSKIITVKDHYLESDYDLSDDYFSYKQTQ